MGHLVKGVKSQWYLFIISFIFLKKNRPTSFILKPDRLVA